MVMVYQLYSVSTGIVKFFDISMTLRGTPKLIPVLRYLRHAHFIVASATSTRQNMLVQKYPQ